jgi:hypothetical protein
VRDHSAPRSRIAFDYVGSGHHNIDNPDTRYSRWGEPWLFGLPGGRASEFLRRAGLEVVSDESGFEYLYRLLPSRRNERNARMEADIVRRLSRQGRNSSRVPLGGAEGATTLRPFQRHPKTPTIRAAESGSGRRLWL